MSEVLKIKIDRAIAGNKIPYDVLYLFPREQRALIPKLWEFALVMPFEDSFKEVVYNLPLSKVSYLKQFRDDDNLNLAVLSSDKTKSKQVKTTELTALWTDLRIKYNLDDRLIVVPVLMSKHAGKYKPKYITSKQWFARLIAKPRRDNKAVNKKSAFAQVMTTADVAKLMPGVSDLAYMVTPFPEPENVIRPICSICPRNLLHLQGQCIPGMQVCYETLDLNLTTKYETKPALETPIEKDPF